MVTIGYDYITFKPTHANSHLIDYSYQSENVFTKNAHPSDYSSDREERNNHKLRKQ